MKTGRRPQPTEVKKARGNPGRRRLSSDDASSAQPGFAAIAPPSQLRQAGVTVWKQIAPELANMNLLRPSDRHAFGRYCESLGHFWDVTRRLHKEGDTYTSESAHGTLKRINPLFLLQERLAKRLEGLEDRFGLSPAARQQILARFAAHQPSLPLSRPEADRGNDGETSSPATMIEDPLAFFARPTLPN